MSLPYPNIPPQYRKVEKVGPYYRNVMVVEVLSTSPLDDTSRSHAREYLEAALDDTVARIKAVYSVEVVTSERFDPMLRDGLRL